LISGGRYDNLAAEFSDQKLPGVGVSVGLTRFMDLLISEGLIDTTQKTACKILISVFSESDRPFCNSVAQELRSLGVATEVFYKSPKLGKQIEYAEGRGMRYVMFIDSATREMQVKDLVSTQQTPVASLQALASQILGHS
jgi:histidyl-tRNA synthetase